MAEIGIIASALQIADIGVRLSLRLYTFGETVASADKSIISISENVSLTSTVLKELGQTLDKDQTTRICSPNAVRTADSIVQQCQRIFQEMDHILVKKFAKIKSAEKDRNIKSAQTLERLRWPFIKGKIELLTSDLERQKSTLVLMLNVIALAKQEFEKTEASTTIAEQTSLIQDLARSNEGYIHKFEQLRLSCPDGPMNQEVISQNNYSLIPTLQAPTAQGFPSISALGAASQRGLSTGAHDFRPESYQGPYTFVPPPDGMRWLLQQYDNLLGALLKEVSEPTYEIAEESRSRIKADIVTSHGREMRHTEQLGYSGAPSLAKPGRFDVQQPPTINPAALKSWVSRTGKPERESVWFGSTQPLDTGLEYHSRKLSPSPPAMTKSHNATRSEKEDGSPAQPEDRYTEIALTRKRKAPGSAHFAKRSVTIQNSNPHSPMRQQSLPSTIQHSDNESSSSRPLPLLAGPSTSIRYHCLSPPPLPDLPSTVQHSEKEPSDTGLPTLQQTLPSTVQQSKDNSSNPGPSVSRFVYSGPHNWPKMSELFKDPTPTTPRFFPVSNPQGHFKTSTRHSSENRERRRSIKPSKRKIDNDNTENSDENVVDRLLAAWTTLPVPVSRTASNQDSFSGVDLE